MELNHLTSSFATTPQIRPEDVNSLAKAGFKAIINNRPDHEGPDQPTSDEFEAEAKRHGLAYWHIPVVPGQATDADVRAFAAAIEAANGPVVAFCRTGGRAASLWKAAQQES